MTCYIRCRVFILTAFALISALILSCCSSRSVYSSGPCLYSNSTGTATIESIETATFAPGVAASFLFTPTDPDFKPLYGEDNGGTLYTGSDQLPSAELLSSNGITVGETLPAVFEEIGGSCAPLILYSFPTLSGFYGQ